MAPARCHTPYTGYHDAERAKIGEAAKGIGCYGEGTWTQANLATGQALCQVQVSDKLVQYCLLPQ